MMLGKRFFPAAVMLNPINWIDGGDGILAGLETVSILLQIVFLKRGVREYV
jgi:UDP-N-acetylmuramyl pentapeptide phosphotransferase/UDP-N-acetylglucosamine-1-phosphate transferase